MLLEYSSFDHFLKWLNVEDVELTRVHLFSAAFIAQRGFSSLDMSSDEMKCSDVVYNSSDFYSFQPVHVLLSINHGGQTSGLVHDVRKPLYSWVFNVALWFKRIAFSIFKAGIKYTPCLYTKRSPL